MKYKSFLAGCALNYPSVMTCLSACQHMTPSTAIEGSKTFSFALNQKPLVEHCVRVVHFHGTPRTRLLRFNLPV